MIHVSRVFALSIPVALALSLAACQSTPTKKTSRRKATTAEPAAAVADEPRRDGGEYRDPLVRATLREKALGLLVNAANSGLPEERANAIEALQVSPGRLYPLLNNALADPNLAVRTIAAMTVGRARIEAAANKVRPLTSDSAGQARAAALFALKRCGENVDLTPLAVMLGDSDLRVRAHAAFLLGELGEPSAVGLLRDAARRSPGKASSSQIRTSDLQIAEARIKLGDEGPLQEVRAALFPAKPEDLEATALACQIIGQVKDHVSVNRLIVLTAAQDDSKQFMPGEIRLGAAAALARMGQRQGSYIADQYRTNASEPLRAQVAFVYGETRQVENLPVLEQMTTDSSPQVRVAAAAAIVKITEANTEAGGGGGAARADP